MTSIDTIARVLEFSTVPAVMISAAGLILLSITNRLGRTVDRSRSLADELGAASGRTADGARAQLTILLRRASILRLSVWSVSFSILLSSLTIFALTLLQFGRNVEGVVLGMFVAGVIALIFSMVCFLIDVSMALRAVRLDLEPHLKR